MPFPVEERFILETQQKLAAKFPTAYIRKMMIENGGEFDTDIDVWTLYPIFDSSDKQRLKRTCNDVVRETQQAREWPGFPANAIAIGGNGTGDQLVLLRRADAPEALADEVYWWDHETDQLEVVADGFDQPTH